MFGRKANPGVRIATAYQHWLPPALIETFICSTFKMMWLPDVKALSFLVHVGFTIGFTTKKVHTLEWPLSEPAGLENRGFGLAGTQF